MATRDSCVVAQISSRDWLTKPLCKRQSLEALTRALKLVSLLGAGEPRKLIQSEDRIYHVVDMLIFEAGSCI